MTDTIKIICYLCPSIPQEIFDIFSEELSKISGVQVEIEYDLTSSGPMTCDNTLNSYDMAFVCSPSYLTIVECPNNKMELLNYNFIYEDWRNTELEPVYYSDVVVHNKSITMENFSDNNLIFGYNDLSSLSGYYSMVQALSDTDKGLDVFKKVVETGSHLNSIELLKNKEIDIACIDSICINNFDTNAIKIGYFGPNPIQPILINSDSKFRDDIIDRFGEIDISKLQKFGLVGIKEIDYGLYENEKRLLEQIYPL